MHKLPGNVSFSSKGELITLRKFLHYKVAREETNSMRSEYQFNTQISNGPCPSGADLDIENINGETTWYKRTVVTLSRPVDGKLSLLKSFLLLQASHHTVFREGVQELFEKLALEHLHEYGSAEYFVRIGPRKWLVANAEDFRYIFDKQGRIALIALAQMRTKIYEVLRITEAEAVEASKKVLENMSPMIDNLLEQNKELFDDLAKLEAHDCPNNQVTPVEECVDCKDERTIDEVVFGKSDPKDHLQLGMTQEQITESMKKMTPEDWAKMGLVRHTGTQFHANMSNTWHWACPEGCPACERDKREKDKA